jgi:hypothetical protein
MDLIQASHSRLPLVFSMNDSYHVYCRNAKVVSDLVFNAAKFVSVMCRSKLELR